MAWARALDYLAPAMRIPDTLILCSALLVPAGCDGALGGNIHDEPVEWSAAESEPEEEEEEAPAASSRRAPRPARPEEPTAPEEDEASPGGETEGDEAVAGAADEPEPETREPDPDPPATGRSGGRGRRGGRRGAGGDHTGTVTVVDTGAAAAGTAGRITGTVFFEGTPPPRTPLAKIAETQGCHAHEETPLSKEVVVHDGKLQNVFVHLDGIPGDVTVPPPPEEPFLLNQVGCTYVPHVAGLQAGRELKAGNGDDTAHNVRCSGVRYPGDNKTIAAGSPPLSLPTPTREEIPIEFKCDIHPWMSAKVCVVEHPWFAVSGPDGTFVIEDVPPGTYGIEAWQETYGKARVSGQVVVGPGGHVRVDFTYEP